MPGAVINSMLYGIIPIVTRWAAFDEVEKLGYLLEDMTIRAVETAIDWSQSLSEREVAHLSRACQHYVQENYTLAVFKDDMIKVLKEIFDANGNRNS